ncbi:hypothetical protein LCGC14_2511040 [marine sediment metagenome]|uniref:Uncharacterized protein n=1 Tax=marine sediment metagenome TaxID=412755 RepID=A0A0F9AZS2_9ZZZZ
MNKGSVRHKRIENLKWCWVCQQYKDISNFCADHHQSGGLASLCKDCNGLYQKPYQADYYLRHREELLPKHNVTARLSYLRKSSKGSREQVEPTQ